MIGFRSKLGRENLLGIGEEGGPGHRPVKQHRRRHAGAVGLR